MPGPARSLYEALRVLERRAADARRKVGLPASRREAASAAGRPPYGIEVDARRISSWLPGDPGLAQVPRTGDADKVWALVRVWSEWAGDQAPQQRYWMDLIEAAQPTRTRKLAEGTAARSAYLQQVGRIAPPELIGREAELAELAAFCLKSDEGPYAWWQAGAWAGKSALLSAFVLRPPPQMEGQVRIVSFFITARLAAQDTRDAFTQALLEQLAQVTGQDLPAVLPEATRDAHLLDLLAQAAAACHRTGCRLVLVVDGLDEDRGVTVGPHAHSIAALLPADPPDGMRVIVAGRPSPPIPDDVPGWHPLRDPEIIRTLSGSPYARDVERLGRQELRRLLHGTAVEQDLLGLLTAARGGLSDADLEELTHAPLGEVQEILHTVAGRTFTRRASQSAPGAGPEMYLLGHEELHTAASHYLGHRLYVYHERLHGWADEYRSRGWPHGTPEYLLSSYYRLLVTLGDLSRMIVCASDAARHDRLLDITGGDAAALVEIRTALDLTAAQDAPDLASALCLACNRDLLTDRNTNIPLGLPAAWATVGQVVRAEALATSIPDPDRRADAMVRVARTLADAGQHQQAATVAGEAEAAARSITGLYRREAALARVAEALAGAGQHQQAEAVARSIRGLDRRADALVQVAGTLAGAGQHHEAARVAGQAEAAARSITDVGRQADVLTHIADELAMTGQHQQAAVAARSITDPGRQADALARVAGTLARAGQRQQAARVAGQAEAAASSISGLYLRASALARVAGTLARAGQQQAVGVAGQAEAAASSITDPYLRASALTRVADALAKAGQRQQAARVAGQAEAAASSITDPYRRASALAHVAEALSKAGQHQQAEAVARSIIDPDLQTSALTRVAEALAKAGQRQQAGAVARSISDPVREAAALAGGGGAGEGGTAAAGRGGGPLYHRPGPAGRCPELCRGGAGQGGTAGAGCKGRRAG